MFLLGFYLISGVLAAIETNIVDNFLVKTSNGYLVSVSATGNSSKHLNLSNLYIHTVADDAFGKLEIEDLSLADNQLEYLPYFAFSSLRDLKRLSLANNRLRDFSYAFGGLEKLEELDIRYNGIDELEESSFYGLTNATKILAEAGNAFGAVCPKHFAIDTVLLRLCVINGTVESLRVYDKRDDDQIECDVKIRPLMENAIELTAEGITGFSKGWYRLQGLNVTSLNLRGNDIAEIRSEILDDLPAELTEVDLSLNEIERVKNGAINNRNLRLLDLSTNAIEFIERDAFANVENLEIRLLHNEVSSAKLVGNLPNVEAVFSSGSKIFLCYIVNRKRASDD